MCASTNALRHMESDHLKVTPKVLSKSVITHLEEELHAIVDGQLLAHLAVEVSEVGLDDASIGGGSICSVVLAVTCSLSL
jgi:hypothetical protein